MPDCFAPSDVLLCPPLIQANDSTIQRGHAVTHEEHIRGSLGPSLLFGYICGCPCLFMGTKISPFYRNLSANMYPF